MHGRNHLWGGGGLEGTSCWFASLGFRPAKAHALMSGYGEPAAGVGLITGFLAPMSCAAVIATMCLAGWAVHRHNGFSIFKDGYEYVLVMGIAALAVAILGPGGYALDDAVGIIDYNDFTSAGLLGRAGALIVLVGGVGCAVALLVLTWRPAAAGGQSK